MRYLLLFILVSAQTAWAEDCKTTGGKSVYMSNGSTTANLTDKVTCTYEDGDKRIITYKAGKRMAEERWEKNVRVRRENYSYPPKFNGNQRRNGKQEEWYANGKPKTVETCVDGDRQGDTFRYFESGALDSRSYYLNDKQLASVDFTKDGVPEYLSCSEEAALAKVTPFNKLCGFLGKPSKVTLYYSKTQKKSLLEFDKGKLISTTKYDDSGKISKVDKKAVGKDGIETSWHPNGKKKQEVRYNKDHYLQGKQREYDESGKLVREADFNNGFMTLEKLYFLNGQMKRLTSKKKKGNDTIVVSKTFYDNGKVQDFGTYKEKKEFQSFGFGYYWDYSYLMPIGKHKHFYESGSLYSVTNYKEGERQGVTTSYQDDGKTKWSETFYEKGEMVRRKEYDSKGKLVSNEEFFKDGSSKKHAVGH